MMPDFIKGMPLCEEFFLTAAKPLLEQYYPKLVYSAGLLGYGSDVLGYDDEVSTDHMWGPRFYLFLQDSDLCLKDELFQLFAQEFPYTFHGYSVNFSVPDENDHGVRRPVPIKAGIVSPLVFINTVDRFLKSYLGTADLGQLDSADWLSFSEHRLLALTAGKFFVDGLEMQKKLGMLRYYPDDVRLYLIASNWSLVAEEQAFVRRTAEVGDEAGSILICARIAERLMRLCFLYCKSYAPYSKWFGTAFQKLPLAESTKSAIQAALAAKEINAREDALVSAQKQLADLHDRLLVTDPVGVEIQPYFGRSSKVIFADRIADATWERLMGSPLAACPLIGSLSSVANFTNLWDSTKNREVIKKFYTDSLKSW